MLTKKYKEVSKTVRASRFGMDLYKRDVHLEVTGSKDPFSHFGILVAELPNAVNVNANLKKVDIAISIAQTENIFLLWVFRDGLDNAVLCKQDVSWGHFLFWAVLPISLAQ